jgi:hypothetical protein
MRAVAVGALLLLVTVARSAGAEEIHPLDPAPPQVGVSASGGSGVGYVELLGTTATAVGAYAAIAHELGPAALEVRYDSMILEENPNVVREPASGELSRVGVTGRLEIGRLGARWVGPYSALVGWVELGVGRQSGRWADYGHFVRKDMMLGAGWTLDHRTNGRRGRPARVGWYFGWRVGAAEALPAKLAARPFGLCGKGQSCPGERPHDRILLLSCGFSFAW